MNWDIGKLKVLTSKRCNSQRIGANYFAPFSSMNPELFADNRWSLSAVGIELCAGTVCKFKLMFIGLFNASIWNIGAPVKYRVSLLWHDIRNITIINCRNKRRNAICMIGFSVNSYTAATALVSWLGHFPYETFTQVCQFVLDGTLYIALMCSSIVASCIRITHGNSSIIMLVV